MDIKQVAMFTIALAFLLGQTHGKGNKLKPTKTKNRDRLKDRNRLTTGSDSSVSSDYNVNDLFAYRFRNASFEEKLLAFLFCDYDPVARATLDTSKTVKVNIQFVLLRIHGLDERSQVLTTTGLIIAEWTDDRLTWDPEKFGNLTDIIVKADKVWLPELALMNGAEELIPDFDRIRVLLKYDGTLHWEPGGIFRTTCDIDITYFPFDTQYCPLLIGAYAYYSSKMNITTDSKCISTHDFQPNGEWHIVGTSAVWNITILQCCPGIGYSHIVFTLHLKRRSKFYIVNIVLPCLMLSVLIMIGFFLPPDAGEKISLGISVLLAFTVFLLMIADNIPRTSLAIPLMVVYLTATMLLGTLSIVMTVIVLNIHHRTPRFPVPRWAKQLMLCYIARFLCVRTHYSNKLKHTHKMGLLNSMGNTTENNVATTNNHHGNYHRPNNNGGKEYRRCKRYQNNGILDEMESMGLTAVLNTRQTNGPTSLPGQTSPNTLGVDQPNSNTEKFGFKRRLSQWTNSFKVKGVLSGSEDEEEEPDYSRDWHELGRVLDRVFFWVLCFLMGFSAVFILLYPKYSGVEQELAEKHANDCT